MSSTTKSHDSLVTLNFHGDVAEITLDRPGGNRISFAMRQAALDAVREVAASSARALLVRATGEDFCLGGDVREWAGVPSQELEPRIKIFATALEELRALPIPTIAAVQGQVRGGGFEFALSCDFIIAHEAADFAFPESQVGIMTLQGGLLQLAERIGRTRALELTTFANVVTAPTLYNWNLVNWVESNDLLAAARRIADQLAHVATATFAASKQLLAVHGAAGPGQAWRQLYSMSMPLFDRVDVQNHLSIAAAGMNGMSSTVSPEFFWKETTTPA